MRCKAIYKFFESRFPCDECDYTANGKSALRMHKKKHDPMAMANKPPPKAAKAAKSTGASATAAAAAEKYSCDMCDFVSDKKLKLHKHKRAAHDAREFLCDKCNYSAAKMCSLKMHVQIVHDGIRDDMIEYHMNEE